MAEEGEEADEEEKGAEGAALLCSMALSCPLTGDATAAATGSLAGLGLATISIQSAVKSSSTIPATVPERNLTFRKLTAVF